MSKLTLEALPDYGDLIDIESFIEGCLFDCFTNDDGHGYLATKDGMNREYSARPSDMVKNYVVPEWATHVMWFNK